MSALVAVLVILAVLTGCKREERSFRSPPPAGEEGALIVMSTNSPGQGEAATMITRAAQQYDGNAFHISEGQRLFRWFNCSGCHANGGGGMGPPLMDDKWIYGSSINNVAASIKEGRPNGMPAFRGKIPDEQVLQIAAFVRSLSGDQPQSATPVRSDHMNAVPQSQKPEPNMPEAGSAADHPQ
jgi:cytochrome c oxidase cbb3-type subunit III